MIPTPAQRREMWQMRKAKTPYKVIAAKFGIGISLVHRICWVEEAAEIERAPVVAEKPQRPADNWIIGR